MATSGSIEIPFAAEWSQLRRDRAALGERLARLESEREKVSPTVFERVRADYLQRQEDLDLRAADLAERAGREAHALADAVTRQEDTARALHAELEEFDLRERLGEQLDAAAAERAAQLRRELAEAEDDLIALVELRDRVAAIAEGRSSGFIAVVSPPPVSASSSARPVRREALPAVPLRSAANAGAAGAARAPEPPEPPAPGAGMPRLVALESADGSDFHRLAGRSVVGRSGESELRLPVGTVSRRHAELEPLADGWIVRDLHSENGTWVNGERIWERQLADGDHVQFGTVCFVFRAG